MRNWPIISLGEPGEDKSKQKKIKSPKSETLFGDLPELAKQLANGARCSDEALNARLEKARLDLNVSMSEGIAAQND